MSFPYPISSDYAAHVARGDPGIDLATPVGVDLYVPRGTWQVSLSRFITRADGSPSYGETMEITDGILRLGFAHLKRRGYASGAMPDSGKVFAQTGDTGNVTGPHVHIWAIKGGVKVDPTNIEALQEVFEVAQFTDEQAKMLISLIKQSEEDLQAKPGAIPGKLRDLAKRVKAIENAGGTPHSHKVTGTAT